MARKSIWIGIGVFILAMLVSVAPSDRRIALSDISLGGSQALAKKGGHGPSHRPFKNRPDLPSIFDTIDDLELDSDDDGGPDDDGPDEGPDDDGPDDGKDDD
jgi:hypothetical protein